MATYTPDLPRRNSAAIPFPRAMIRAAELRRLPLAARRIATRFGIEAHTAQAIAVLAGLGSEGGR